MYFIGKLSLSNVRAPSVQTEIACQRPPDLLLLFECVHLQ